MCHGFLTWYAEMSPLQEEWRNCGQRGLCRSKGWPSICMYQVSSITSHSLQTHLFVICRHHPSTDYLYNAAWDCVLVCPGRTWCSQRHWWIDIANLCGSWPDGMLVGDVYISNVSAVEVSGCGVCEWQLWSHKIPVLPLTFQIPLPSPSPHLTSPLFNLFPPR